MDYQHCVDVAGSSMQLLEEIDLPVGENRSWQSLTNFDDPRVPEGKVGARRTEWEQGASFNMSQSLR